MAGSRDQTSCQRGSAHLWRRCLSPIGLSDLSALPAGRRGSSHTRIGNATGRDRRTEQHAPTRVCGGRGPIGPVRAGLRGPTRLPLVRRRQVRSGLSECGRQLLGPLPSGSRSAITDAQAPATADSLALRPSPDDSLARGRLPRSVVEVTAGGVRPGAYGGAREALPSDSRSLQRLRAMHSVPPAYCMRCWLDYGFAISLAPGRGVMLP